MKLDNEDEWDWLPATNGSVIIRAVKILVAITGASGALYAQRLLDTRTHEIHVVLSHYAPQIIAGELPGSLRLPPVKTQSTARTACRALPADNFFHIRVHPCPSVVKNVFLN
jgi:hypothetical protein